MVCARAVLTDSRCSMMMQLVQVKMNEMLLEGEALSCCAESMLAMTDDEASFEGILDDLQQFEGEGQAGHAEQQGADDLLSDAEGSVASEAVMLMVDLF
jgi:hypothetical protein